MHDSVASGIKITFEDGSTGNIVVSDCPFYIML
jgi:hypothetical protein